MESIMLNKNFGMNNKSLKKVVLLFGKQKFPIVFPTTIKRFYNSFLKIISSKAGGLLVICFAFLFIIFGQFFHPHFLQVIPLSDNVAKIIVDQRTTNLATIFSITLVVIGWLITNTSIKESISFQLLFKKTYIYPIFYFVISLIGFLMIASLLREANWIDLGKLVISATYLILIGLTAITFLFFRLVTVVRTNFFYASLEDEVMEEVIISAREEILRRKSTKIYKDCCQQLGLLDGISFGTDLSSHKGINITPLSKNIKDDTSVDFFLTPKKNYLIADVNIASLKKQIEAIEFKGTNYYRPISLGYTINENYNPFYFDSQTENVSKIINGVKKSFKIKISKKMKNHAKPNLDYLCQRFEKDVEDGKKENIEMALAIFSKIFLLENQIIKEC
jgi:hypothetical protein